MVLVAALQKERCNIGRDVENDKYRDATKEIHSFVVAGYIWNSFKLTY